MTSGVFENIDRFEGNVAVIDPSAGVVSYGEMLARADAIAAAVSGRPLVLVACANTLDCLVGYVGLSRAGIPMQCVHHGIRSEHLAAIVGHFRPSYVYAPRGAFEGKEVSVAGAYALVSTGWAADFPIHDALGLLLTTSGTTGSRKFVRLSAANLASNALSIAEYLGIAPDHRAITTMPMSYSYGLSIVNSHLARGASLVLTEDAVIKPDFWRLIRDHDVTTFGGVPFIYETLKKLRFDRMDSPSLRTLTQAGGRLHPDLAREFIDLCAARGMEYIVMYGQTEATARISYLPWTHARAKCGTIGVAIPGGSLSIMDDRGQEIDSVRTPGELVYRGPNVSLGYAEGWADLARGDENCGVLFTGDIAVRDEDGFFSIVGRKKRFLKIFGNRVNLDEIEQILKGAGFNAACTGDDDRLVVHVAGGVDPAAVEAALRGNLAIPPRALQVAAIAAIPTSESGKVDYAALEKT